MGRSSPLVVNTVAVNEVNKKKLRAICPKQVGKLWGKEKKPLP